jgi:ubiquinone/menaquinone biosynthesis C-methylase UbiE
MRTLDLGCGSNKTQGALGADLTKGSDADVIADLDHIYYPFKDSSFDRIIFNHVIEHLTDVPKAMEEICRICTPNGILQGETPHFSSSASYTDPTHRHHFSIRTFDFLASPGQVNHGILRRVLCKLYRLDELKHRPRVVNQFQKIEVRLRFNPLFRRVGIEWLANIYPELYESFFAFIFPARDIVFRLKALK